MPVIRYPRYMENACCPILKSVAMQTPISTATHTHSCTHLRKAPHMMHMHMETAYNHSPIAKHRGKTTSLNLVRSPSPLLFFSLSLSPSLLLLLLSRSLSGWGKREKKWRRDRNAISATLTLRLLWLSPLLSPLHFFPLKAVCLKCKSSACVRPLPLPPLSPLPPSPQPPPGCALNNGIAGCKYFPLRFRTAFLSGSAVEGICGSYRLWLGQLLSFFLSLSFFPRVCFPVVRQRNEGQSWGGGWGWGVRDAERERAIWRREKEEEGRKASDGDGCSMVLDAAERRRGREERREWGALGLSRRGRASRINR